ncbi:hypothetical protein [Microbacterium sp. Ag1]|uniref:hypothetical protein n=1 Tax=Microbacterium sp. Ag1 TaxID=1643443 RepID=UPI0006299C20|nr:hypothetical protein [Microbacterium sp. Ag1]KKX97192.1 hypothetical protein AAY78_14540 [Microbacterium sp. Ag1]
MTVYRVGDIPAEPLAIVPTRDGEPVELGAFANAEVKVDTHTLFASIADDAVVAPWPVPSIFETPGLLGVTVTLTGPGTRESFEAEPIIVDPVDTFSALDWHTVTSARRVWTNKLTDEALYVVLAGSRRACLAHLELDDADAFPVPSTWRDAQIMQARNVLNSGTVKPGGGFGNDEYEYGASSFPLDWSVRALLRPVRVPKVR